MKEKEGKGREPCSSKSVTQKIRLNFKSFCDKYFVNKALLILRSSFIFVPHYSQQSTILGQASRLQSLMLGDLAYH